MKAANFQLDISGMTCAACAGRIRRVLARDPAIAAAEVDFVRERARIELAEGVSEAAGVQTALELIRKAGYDGFARGGSETARKQQREAREAGMRAEDRRLFARAALALLLALPFLVDMVAVWLSGHSAHFLPLSYQIVAASLSQLVCAWPFYRGAVAALRAGGSNMDVLVVLGTLTAYFLSIYNLGGSTAAGHEPVFFEASVWVIAFVLLGKSIERRARHEAGAALTALAGLLPNMVTQLTPAGPVTIPISALSIGMRIVVKPGQRLPVDGVIEEGEAFFDESSLTGETMPLRRGPGERVSSGSEVSGGAVILRAEAVADETRLARLARLIEDQAPAASPVPPLVDRISAYFVPAIVVLALLSFAGWWLAGVGVTQAAIIAASVLVVACPCALGLATPIALVAGASAGARQGLLITDLGRLDAAAGITHLAFDKTGTLTAGRPGLAGIRLAPGESEARVLALAAALAQNSEHPLDLALTDAAKAAQITPAIITDFVARAGGGLEGRQDGQSLKLGALDFVATDALARQAGEALRAALPDDLALAPSAFLALEGRPVALFSFGDAIRPEAEAAIGQLKALGVASLLLSGDRQEVAAAVAAKLGITEARGGLKPEDKVRALNGLHEAGAVTAFVGDGLNDGPALRAAAIGIAMGQGTEVAKGAAGMLLARGDLALLPLLVRLARRTRGAIRENLVLAFVFNGIALPLAMAGELSPGLAGAAMAMSSLAVVFNALRLSRWRG